ncbi:enoyl-[acyl-carrier-protein] reductase mitochondrial [Holotrichia oblita]|uniref:Enoyl-[acyl-carrier-protein] reductase mitochondrial n=1 Tax=Holotrichia oblita TaxID=644536 RepID=A0ACB9SPJ0_HOLOL|nr:enoyl-[acyl-carrier-protein] reductase mitochondrial [Holotrichia oblita]
MANRIFKSSYVLQKAAAPRSISYSIRRQSIIASKLVFTQYGEPRNVLRKESEELNGVNDKQVLLKMLAAPINPADMNTIQGTYAVKPKLPAVGGNEGVGEIVSVGNNVKNFAVGDRAVPLVNALGTWRSHLIVSEENILKVPKELGLVEAATITVNPTTAFRMLKDFVNLKENDVVIQNGANSTCGQYAIQLCKAWGIKSVNIVRNRQTINDLKLYLKELGADHVLTEEELRQTDLFRSKKLPKPKLALNCVGGKSATELMRQLETGGVIVTYGGMSREPVTVATSALIFKDIRIVGYWMTRWSNENAKSPARFNMYDELIDLMRNGKLRAPVFEFVRFDNFKNALENTLTAKGMAGKKYILQFE